MKADRPTWYPAITRLALFTFVSGLTIAVAQADKMTYEQVRQFVWWDWSRFWAPIVIACTNTVISFLDQSMARIRQEQDEHDSTQSSVTLTEKVVVK